MTTEELQAIRERCEKATPGPWQWDINSYRGGFSGISSRKDVEVLYPDHCNDGDDGAAWFASFPSAQDADFIVQARADVPALLAEIDRLQKELKIYQSPWNVTRGKQCHA